MLEPRTDPITLLKARLAKHPQVAYEIADRTIDIQPIDARGFRASLVEHESGLRYTVAFEGWHQDFGDPAEALRCITLGLSPTGRLQVWSRGPVDYRWTFEQRRGTDWVTVSTSGVVLFPFWRRVRMRYLQNRILEGG